MSCEGDALLLVFPDPLRALQCCVALQQRLGDPAWLDGLGGRPGAGGSGDSSNWAESVKVKRLEFQRFQIFLPMLCVHGNPSPPRVGVGGCHPQEPVCL